MKSSVEDALAECGRDRVFYNETQVSVAIRLGNMFNQPAEKWLVRKGSDMDEAGANVAIDFASAVRDEGQRLIEWSKRIRNLLTERAGT